MKIKRTKFVKFNLYDEEIYNKLSFINDYFMEKYKFRYKVDVFMFIINEIYKQMKEKEND